MTQYILGNEYTIDWPLGTDEEGSCPPGEPALSEGLQAEICEWAATFNDGYMPDSGWQTKSAAVAHRHQADRLVSLIAGELGPGDTIILRYWETLYVER
ncbi:hypothetical protein [Curtobacterium sp. ISL-83]|uniref:hypothetical protein n=1 Tax=Curtobacterium sp. ISL-83 TaxID=2819145 RepID=UPI001BE849BF|nr:hypothetical protein [Curtobacterium sp. ISL-83]MBT2503495.1 hypothetical protein [Curtobacterium sp. ISL-83]